MRKRLTKSKDNVVIAGVLGGIAEYIGIDPTILRVLYVVLAIFSAGFPSVILYLILMFVIPSGKKGRKVQNQYAYYESDSKNGRKGKRKEAEKVDNDDWSDF